VARNTLESAGYAQLDLRLSHDLKPGGAKTQRTIALAVDIFNLLNRANYGSYVGTIGSPLFDQPVTARPPRQMQFTLRAKF
jgi:hypothetical protein